MIIPFTLLLGTIAYVFYNSKEEVPLIEENQFDSPYKNIEGDDLYRDLEDLFI